MMTYSFCPLMFRIQRHPPEEERRVLQTEKGRAVYQGTAEDRRGEA